MSLLPVSALTLAPIPAELQSEQSLRQAEDSLLGDRARNRSKGHRRAESRIYFRPCSAFIRRTLVQQSNGVKSPAESVSKICSEPASSVETTVWTRYPASLPTNPRTTKHHEAAVGLATVNPPFPEAAPVRTARNTAHV